MRSDHADGETMTVRRTATQGGASATVLALGDPYWPGSQTREMGRERAGEELPI
jgi:hypothetical protein